MRIIRGTFQGSLLELSNDLMSEGYSDFFDADDFEWNRSQGSIAFYDPEGNEVELKFTEGSDTIEYTIGRT